MGVKERRERQKELLRQDILDAARELFIKEGYENVSMRKIAEKIEYSPTTIYLYFEDKSDLLHSLCEETFTKMLDSMKAFDSQSNDPLVCLKKGLRTYIQFGLDHPNHYKVTFITHPEHHEKPEKFLNQETMGQKAYFHLRAKVEQCIKQQKFRLTDADTATQGLWAAVHGVTSLLIVHPDFHWVEQNKLIDHVIDTMTESLKV